MFVGLKKNGDLELTPENDDEKKFVEHLATIARDGGFIHGWKNPTKDAAGCGLEFHFEGEANEGSSSKT